MMRESTNVASLNSLSSVLATFLNSESKRATLRCEPVISGKLGDRKERCQLGACLAVLELSIS